MNEFAKRSCNDRRIIAGMCVEKKRNYASDVSTVAKLLMSFFRILLQMRRHGKIICSITLKSYHAIKVISKLENSIFHEIGQSLSDFRAHILHISL